VDLCLSELTVDAVKGTLLGRRDNVDAE
jgi:hypothetical protein